MEDPDRRAPLRKGAEARTLTEKKDQRTERGINFLRLYPRLMSLRLRLVLYCTYLLLLFISFISSSCFQLSEAISVSITISLSLFIRGATQKNINRRLALLQQPNPNLKSRLDHCCAGCCRQLTTLFTIIVFMVVNVIFRPHDEKNLYCVRLIPCNIIFFMPFLLCVVDLLDYWGLMAHFMRFCFLNYNYWCAPPGSLYQRLQPFWKWIFILGFALLTPAALVNCFTALRFEHQNDKSPLKFKAIKMGIIIAAIGVWVLLYIPSLMKKWVKGTLCMGSFLWGCFIGLLTFSWACKYFNGLQKGGEFYAWFSTTVGLWWQLVFYQGGIFTCYFLMSWRALGGAWEIPPILITWLKISLCLFFIPWFPFAVVLGLLYAFAYSALWAFSTGPEVEDMVTKYGIPVHGEFVIPPMRIVKSDEDDDNDLDMK